MKWAPAIIFLIQGVVGNNLVTVSLERSSSVCCHSRNLKSCNPATVDPAVLGKDSLILPGGLSVAFLNNIAGDSNAYHYGGKDGSIIATYNPRTGGMHGHATTSSGESFILEYCGAEGHVWKEVNVESLGEDKGVEAPTGLKVRPDHADLVNLARADNTTASTYTVKIYYTPSFAAVTPDIEGFVDQAIAESNQGYANSEVPVKVSVHCIEAATIDDNEDSSAMLKSFANMKSSYKELRGSADVASLMILEFDNCGIGYVNSINSGATFSVTQKTCAVGYYSFAHEIGHNFGMKHNPEVSSNPYYPYGHAHLIEKGSASTGYRTILAYTATGYRTRVNYYSNPSVTYPQTGTSTGVAGLSNNAAILLLNRMSMAGIGDQSEEC